MGRRWHGAATACKSAAWASAAMLAPAAAAQTSQDHLQHQWYRVEVALFQQTEDQQTEDGAALPRVVDAMRYPRLTIPLAELSPPADAMPVGASLAVEDEAPLVISNLAPPIWYAGACSAEFWQPTAELQYDPCLPQRDIDLEAYFGDDPFAVWGDDRQPVEEATVEPESDPVQLALEALTAAVAEHERQLMETSYVWRRRTPELAPVLRRLRRGRNVIVAGSWHQALPPRDAPQPLVVQVGSPDAVRRFPLEGWFSVTVGRYVHLRAHLLYRLADDGVAVFDESRRMRSDELHYLDHPALGILALVQPVQMPSEIDQLAEEYRLAAGR